jgi:hypothetical protein
MVTFLALIGANGHTTMVRRSSGHGPVQETVHGDHFRNQPAEPDIPDLVAAAQMVGDLPRQLPVRMRPPRQGQRTSGNPGQALGDIGVTPVVMVAMVGHGTISGCRRGHRITTVGMRQT